MLCPNPNLYVVMSSCCGYLFQHNWPSHARPYNSTKFITVCWATNLFFWGIEWEGGVHVQQSCRRKEERKLFHPFLFFKPARWPRTWGIWGERRRTADDRGRGRRDAIRWWPRCASPEDALEPSRDAAVGWPPRPHAPAWGCSACPWPPAGPAGRRWLRTWWETSWAVRVNKRE